MAHVTLLKVDDTYLKCILNGSEPLIILFWKLVFILHNNSSMYCGYLISVDDPLRQVTLGNLSVQF